jgi:hypothetical protein
MTYDVTIDAGNRKILKGQRPDIGPGRTATIDLDDRDHVRRETANAAVL